MTQTDIRIEISTINDMKRLQQWVCWVTDTKVPINPLTTQAAKSNDPETWAAYEDARKLWASDREKYGGIGFALLKEQHLTLTDYDHCIDESGQISEYAQKWIAEINSYAEISPSGHGIHILSQGDLPSNIGPDPDRDAPNQTEMYDCKRYITVTGKHIEGTPLTFEPRQEALLRLHKEVTQARAAAKELAREKKAQAAQPPPNVQITTTSQDTPYGLKALTDECSDLATTTGGRNNRLNAIAYKMGQYIGGGELTRETVEQALYNAAQTSGLGDSEIDKTMRSGLESGLCNPRSAPAMSESDDELPNLPTLGRKITKELLCSFDPDDSGNGDAMYVLYHKKFLYCSTLGWLTYTGTHWKLDTDGCIARQYAVNTLRRRRRAAVSIEGKEPVVKATIADSKRVTGCLDRFKTLVSVDIGEFDTDHNAVNCLNGVVDIRTLTITSHSHSQRFTYCLDYPFKKCDMGTWLNFLASVVGGGQEVIDYLQKLCGYSLTGHTREELLVYLHGPTRAGKGTFADVFRALLPAPFSTQVDFNSFTAKRENDSSNFDLAPLKASRMIFASESQKSQSLNPAKIKTLTGGDSIYCCFKNKTHFAYKPQYKIWMLSNWPVNGDPEDDALWSRVRVINFPNSHLGHEDKELKQKLTSPEVLQSVLYWSILGAHKWYGLGSSGLATPQSVIDATNEQRAEQDTTQQWLDENTTRNPDAWTANDMVTSDYLEWCKANNIQHPKGAKALAQSLKMKGYNPGIQKWVDGKNKKGVRGLVLASPDRDNDPDPELENENPSDILTPNGSNVSIGVDCLVTRGSEMSENHTLDPLGVRNSETASENQEERVDSNKAQKDAIAALKPRYEAALQQCERIVWNVPDSIYPRVEMNAEQYRQQVKREWQAKEYNNVVQAMRNMIRINGDKG